MSKESDHEYKWGHSWQSPFIVEGFDRLLLERGRMGKDILIKNYINILISHLIIEKIPTELIEHLKVELVKPKTENEIPGNIDEKLLPIFNALNAEFGHEVTRRINLSISEGKVRTV